MFPFCRRRDRGSYCQVRGSEARSLQVVRPALGPSSLTGKPVCLLTQCARDYTDASENQCCARRLWGWEWWRRAGGRESLADLEGSVRGGMELREGAPGRGHSMQTGGKKGQACGVLEAV